MALFVLQPYAVHFRIFMLG